MCYGKHNLVAVQRQPAEDWRNESVSLSKGSVKEIRQLR